MQSSSSRFVFSLCTGMLLLSPLAINATRAFGQAAPAAAAPAQRVLGTVKAVSASVLTLTKDDGGVVMLTLGEGMRVQQLPAGSADIKLAQPATVSDIAEGDRVLVAAHPGDAGALTATRVVLMKSGAIAQNNAARQADWQRRGSGGIVSALDASAKTITLTSGTRKTTVQTNDRTVFRRYAPGSVKFEEAKAGSFGEIALGDQVRVRGSKDVDTGSIAAEEVVSGAFRNLAGTVVSLDSTAGTLLLKDLATKKTVLVKVSAETDLRNLPPQMAAGLAARARPAAAGPAGSPAPGAALQSTARPAGSPPPVTSATPAGPGESSPSAGRMRGAGAGGGDLAQMVPRLPKVTLAELKPGEALLVVGSGSAAPGASITAITLLSGVESLLAASPEGTSSFNLSPWSLGGGGEAAAAGGTQ